MSRIASPVKYIFTFGLLLFPCCATDPWANAEETRLTRDEVVAAVLKGGEIFKRQKNWMVRYTNVRQNVEPEPGAEIRWPPAELVNARNDKGWIYTYIKQADLGDRFKMNHWIGWKDNVCIDRHEGQVSILPEPSTSFFNYFYYPGMLWFDVFSDITVKSPAMKKAFGSERPSDAFPEAFSTCLVRNKTSYIVRPELERVDDGLCYVLEHPQKDIIWVDPNLGFMARKRVHYEGGTKLWESKNEQFKDFGGGLWLPQKQDMLVYNAPNAGPKYLGKVAVHQINTVADLRINDVPDSFFDVPIPDDATIDDYIRGKRYLRPKPSNDPLETAIEQAEAYGGVQNAGNWLKLCVLCLILVGFGLLGYFSWRKSRSRVRSAG